MNCDQFEQRLQSVLDRRADPGNDPALAEHAAACEECYGRLHLWLQIGDALGDADVWESKTDGTSGVRLPRPAGVGPSGRRAILTLLATAGAVMAMWGLSKSDLQPVAIRTADQNPTIASVPSPAPGRPPRDNDASAMISVAENEADLQAIGERGLLNGSWQSVRWWNDVSDDRWDALAGVDSVREGVAPIGRSMRRAVTILMTHAARASVTSPQQAPELPADAINEQTSDRTDPLSTLRYA